MQDPAHLVPRARRHGRHALALVALAALVVVAAIVAPSADAAQVDVSYELSATLLFNNLVSVVPAGPPALGSLTVRYPATPTGAVASGPAELRSLVASGTILLDGTQTGLATGSWTLALTAPSDGSLVGGVLAVPAPNLTGFTAVRCVVAGSLCGVAVPLGETLSGYGPAVFLGDVLSLLGTRIEGGAEPLTLVSVVRWDLVGQEIDRQLVPEPRAPIGLGGAVLVGVGLSLARGRGKRACARDVAP